MRDSEQKGFTAVEAILIIVIVAIIGFAGWFVWHSQNAADKTLSNASGSSSPTYKSKSTVTNFEQCKAAEGSVMQMTYPEQCVTKDGKSFTNTGASASSQSYLVIKEWGVKMSLDSAVLSNATYVKKAQIATPGVEGFNVMTKDTENMDFTCGGDGTGSPVTHITGNGQNALLRSKDASALTSESNHVSADFTKIGDYYYVYAHNTGFGSCSITEAATATRAKAVADAYANSKIVSE